LEQFFKLLEIPIELQQHCGLCSNSSRSWKKPLSCSIEDLRAILQEEDKQDGSSREDTEGGHRDLKMTVVGFTVLHYLCTLLPPQNSYAHVLHLLLLLLLLPACLACLLCFALLHDQIFMLL
jgi:hypothetical protein